MWSHVAVGILLGTAAVQAGPSGAQDEVRVLLFDFEDGVQEWWGNPWGGGECEVAPAAQAKFGAGALTCAYRDVERGANAVSPFLPEDAGWRGGEWGGLSLWLKGDGSATKISIALETTQEGSTGFSARRPLEDDSWRRIYIPWRNFWSREKLRVDSSKLRRVIIGCSGTHEFLIDQLALEPAGRPVLADADASVEPGSLNALVAAPGLTALAGGGIEARLDLSTAADHGDLILSGAISAPRSGQAQAQLSVAGQDATAREASVLLPLAATEDEVAKVRIEVAGADGQALARWGYSFPVFGPEEELTKPPIAIYPAPKELRRLEGRLRFGKTVQAASVGLEEEDVRRTLGMFAREMKDYYDRPVTIAGGASAGDAHVVVATAPSADAVPKGLLPVAMAERLDDIGDEGYLLRVTSRRAAIVARTPRGVYYGLHSLLAAIDDETAVPADPAAPCCEIVDWPSFAYRGASIPNPTGRWSHPNDAWMDVNTFNEFVFRTFARQKLNKLVFIINEGMEFDSHPELRAPQAWSKDELRAFVDFARENYIEVIPLVTVLGHANWFTLKHRELTEPGHKPNIACVRLPETNQLITDVFEEVIEVFEPTTFHIGMDECWWQTLNLPEEERCPRCKSDWPDIVAEQAIIFHDFLAKKGIRAMMWDDMLLPEHNGGAPYHTSRALKRIPGDMVIANWSAGLAPDSCKRFRDAGLSVVRSNSLGVPRNDRPYVIGNMMGLWNKVPWLTDTYYKMSTRYSYLTLVHAAEFSWNVDPRLGGRGFDESMLAERADSLLRRIALQPSPHDSATQTPIDLSAAFNRTDLEADVGLSALPTGEVAVGRTRFSLPDAGAIVLTDDSPEVTIELNQPAASVHLLVTCLVAEEDREAFVEEFHKQEAIGGVRIGAASFVLGDGSEDEAPLLYAYNVLRWDRRETPPYLFRSLGSLGDSRAFVVQWVNPTPDQPVRSIRFTKADTDAVPIILAATAVAPLGQ